MLPHIILILFVVCTVGICEFCPFSFLFFRVSNLLLWAPSAAYNNLIDTLPFISLYIPQIRGSCGHLKGKYNSHSSCINCSGCSRFNCCVQCHSLTVSIWDLAEKRRSFRGRQMGKKKVSRGNSRRAFVRNALLGLIHRTTRPGHRWSVWMMTPLRGNRHPLCIGHHRGKICD